MTPPAWIAIIAICVTTIIALTTALVNFAHKQGKAEGRIESLETWRDRVRNDMHEVSDKLESIFTKVGRVETLIEERTDKKRFPCMEFKETE